MPGEAGGYGVRPRTIAIAVHHTTGPLYQNWVDIANFHINSRGYNGIGYNVGIDPEGQIAMLGDLDSWRAHVLNMNDRLVGLVLMGEFQVAAPPLLQQQGLRDAITWLRSVYGDIPVKGHRDFLATACPGDFVLDLLAEWNL